MRAEWNNEYRLGDMIYSHLVRDKYKQLYSSRYANSIVSKYMKRTTKSRDLDILESIIKEYSPRIKPRKNTLVIHLRVGDVVKRDVDFLLKQENLIYTKPLSYYKDVIKDYTKIKSITLVAGGCFLKELYTEMGYNVNVRIGKNADDDFVFMSRAKHFIPGGGKFSNLINQLHKKNEQDN